jgi:alkylhydroperoxidase/carboxymuconolactone decarboxylase family protein YurZ
MDLFVKDLPPDTQILIAIGSAVAAGCQPCLERIVSLAKSQEIADLQMRAAVTIGQFVKDQPRQHMKDLAEQLLGPRLFEEAIQGCGCPAETDAQAQCCG